MLNAIRGLASVQGVREPNDEGRFTVRASETDAHSFTASVAHPLGVVIHKLHSSNLVVVAETDSLAWGAAASSAPPS